MVHIFNVIMYYTQMSYRDCILSTYNLYNCIKLSCAKQCCYIKWGLYTAIRDFWNVWWQQTYQVKSILLGKCVHAQNYLNNGNLPGKSAATQCSKVSHCMIVYNFRYEDSSILKACPTDCVLQYIVLDVENMKSSYNKSVLQCTCQF